MPLTDEGIIEVPGMLSRWVRLGSGAKAHYMTSGESGPAVVLLHGGIIGSSGTAGWRFMAPFLGANGFRVFCPDMPAFGLTEDPDDVYAFGEGGHADFVHDFVNAVCLDKFHISGNSMGCSNAVNYVTAHPERILSYALIAGGVGDIVPMPEMMAADPRPMDVRPNIMQFDGTPESMRAMMEAIIYRGGAISDDLITMRTKAANHHREAYTKRMQMMMADNGRDGAVPDVNKAARMREVEQSLRRLDTDHIDIYHLHHPDLETAIEDTLRATDDLIRQGKVRYVGLSTYNGWQLTQAVMTADHLGLARPILNQVPYSLVNRWPEAEVQPAALELGLSLNCFSPLAGGALAGAEVMDREYTGLKRWGMPFDFPPEQKQAALELDALAQKWGHKPAHLALAWLLSRPGVGSAIIGPETSAELTQNAGVFDLDLDDAQIAEIDAIGTPPMNLPI